MGTITFAGAGATLVVEAADLPANGGTFQNVLSGFDVGGVLDLRGLAYVPGATAIDPPGSLTVTDGGTTELYALSSEPAPGTMLYTWADPFGGTDVSSIACYCPGTMIRTPGGDVAIEGLGIGDVVLTAGGRVREIVWIGRRAYSRRFVRGRRHLMPVRIAAGALGENVPNRDLLVSPKHAMFLDGMLVPAVELVNGVSVVQVSDGDAVEYIHLELESHDLLVANNAASESYVDDDNRMMFQNAADHAARFPHWVAVPAVYCAERVEDGYALEALRVRVDGLAGVRVRA